MKNVDLYVLSGGAGTRLWPFSRESYPKQFLDLTGAGEPLLIRTLRRLEGLGETKILTTKGLQSGTQGLVSKFKMAAEVLIEPESRNTGAAVLLASWMSHRNDPDSVVAVFPADHEIRDTETFRKVVAAAIRKASEGSVVTLGITPTYPSTAYGYMELVQAPGAASGDRIVSTGVKRFLEKPSESVAADLIKSGKVVWNAGIFFFPARLMLDLFKQHQPEAIASFSGLAPDLGNLHSIYSNLKIPAVDVAIMEKLDSIECFPVEMGWSDIGSWEEVAKLSTSSNIESETDGKGNFSIALENPRKRVSFIGCSDLFVVDTPDALLIAKKGEGQKVKQVVERLRAAGETALLKTHSFEERPWGRFEILRDEPHFKSKIITVLPGQRLSYQSHEKRAEHWILVKGRAEVTLDDKVHTLEAGQHIFIPRGARHRIANPYDGPVEFIEVQTGTYFGEDDIKRYSDDYGRQ